MIYPNHKSWAHVIFKKYLKKLFKKNFHRINLIGEVPAISGNSQIILTPNHSTWWDGFLVYLINDAFFQREFYVMILEEQLNKYKFFTKLGGFSIRHDSPKKIIESLEFCRKIISRNTKSIITIFPQGELLPSFVRPIQTRKGIDKLLTIHKNITVLPLAIKIEYLKEEKPEVFFSFAEPFDNSAQPVNMDIGKLIELQLNRISECIINKEYGETILMGKESISQLSKNFFSIIKGKNIDV